MASSTTTDYSSTENDLIPHAVVSRLIDGASLVRAWREHCDLTQEEVAKRMGVSKSAYGWLEGPGKPTKETLQVIAKAFGIKPRLLET
jgi:transcriptional regulator with XRE-family HTH domain